jgi:uncharacterized protein YjfI (DUF2170 family)
MSESRLDDIAFNLNECRTPSGTTFEAIVNDGDGTVTVSCSNSPEFPIVLAQTQTQILSVCPLFNLSDVDSARHAELSTTLLQLSPVIPLSSLGYQGESVIMFGAMAINTVFDNIAHELEVQASNTLDVLDALTEFFN